MIFESEHSAWKGPLMWVRDSLNACLYVLHYLRGERLDYQVLWRT
jgi:hypothetical protein